MTYEGRCLCGAVRFSCTGPVDWVLHCHCESCRRATASPMTTLFSLPDAQVTCSGDLPGEFESSPGVTRGFCRTCGSPLYYRNASLPGETHIYAALLADPDALVPEGHDFLDERIGWMHPIPHTKATHD